MGTILTNVQCANTRSSFFNSCVNRAVDLMGFDRETSEWIEKAESLRTTRQASKFRNGKGIVYKTITNLI